jgi:hypothetical protein
VLVRGQQARALTRYLQRQVRAYSPYYRDPLERARRARDGRSGVDLANLPLTPWSAITDPRQFVLHPDFRSIRDFGEPVLGVRTLWARVTGRTAALNRTHIDPRYKPIRWLMAEGVPVGYSSDDLERLAELGRKWLENAGVRPSDVLVSVVPIAPTLGYLELVLAARRAGLSTALLPPDVGAADVARLRPTVLAGRPDDLERVLSGPPEDLAGVRTVLAVDEPLAPGQRARMEASLVADDAAVLSAWAPAGVRALWTECRGQTGLHTAPDAEYLEVVDDEIVWTAIGWSGTVFVRLRTGVVASMDGGTCRGCGRATPRVVVEGAPLRRTPPRRRREPLRVARPVPDAAPGVPELDADEIDADAVEALAEVAEWSAEPASAWEAEEEPEEEVEDEPEEEAEREPMANGARPAFAAVLDGHAGVAAWQAELRTWEGAEELIVFFSPGTAGAVNVLTDLAGEIDVTQFVVLDEEAVLERLARHDQRQVVDLR